MSDNSEQIYGGRWRVIGEIGRGGQGIVYKVEDISGLESEGILLESFNNALRNVTASIATAAQTVYGVRFRSGAATKGHPGARRQATLPFRELPLPRMVFQPATQHRDAVLISFWCCKW